MTKIIAHFGDVHIHNLHRHDEYRTQFNKIYSELRKINPDRIVIAGDLFEEFVSITNEAKDLAGEFLNNLADIAKVILVVGNHDIMKKNKKRLNSVLTVVRLLKNKNIEYLPNTDFYQDDEIVWVNYSHLEKHIDPWKDIQHTKDESKIYIALFHDPINGSKTDTGATFKKKKYKPITFFDKNDYVMLADIHKRQYFRDNKSAAFCGSTLQQGFGENIENHGFLVWNIDSPTDFTVDEYNIQNDHNYINIVVDVDTDYNNLDLNHKLLNPQSEVKIKWNDISAKVNFENEIKLRQYFKEKFGITNVRIVKNSIYTDVSNVQMITESIDVLNLDNQRKIFSEYLKLNGYELDFIDEILKIDDIINDRLKLNESNLGLSWSIDKIWYNNFKSYGDNNIIDFKELGNNSLIQISGLNQDGKTTILDAICYILYGKTTTTLKREKNGDNRYINNKRDLNTCDGGAVITINNETYTIIRETERKFNRDKTGISSCVSNVDYYLGTDLSDENKLTGERKTNTQEIIDNAIGDFSDFIRLTMTTSDNLNELLSMDRSTFMDAIIKDAGYDIFEKKLSEFKEYRKELSKNRINVDVEQNKLKISDLIEVNIEENTKLEEILSNIEKLEESKPSLTSKKEKIIQQLEKIDESLYNFDTESINELIEQETEKLNKRNIQLNKIEQLKLDVITYSPDELNIKKTKQSELKDIISENNSELKDYEIKLSKLNSSINTINSEIKNETNSYITDLKINISNNETKISNIKEEFNNNIIHLKSTLKDELNSLIVKKNDIKNEIELLMEQGKTIKVETENLQNSLDNVCITCNRKMDESSVIVVNGKISENTKLMVDIMNNIKTLKPKIVEIDIEIDNINEKLTFISNKDYSFDIELNSLYEKTLKEIKDYKTNNIEIEKTIELIKNDNIPSDLKLKLESYTDKKEIIFNDINDINVLKIKLSKTQLIKNEELEILSDTIKELTEKDNIYIKNMEIINLEDKIKLEIEKITTLIEKYNNQIDLYNKQLDKIQNNIKVKNEIECIGEEISTLENLIKEKNNLKNQHVSKLLINNHEINRLNDDNIKFEKQKKQDEIFESYQKCVHRDGIPTHLLKMSIHIINESLNNILTDVDFTIFFDEELNIKLSSNNRLDVSQNAIESSGKERTFSSVALKIALRSINNKSRPNLLIFDEMMGKLDENSVEEFIRLIDSIKNEIDKLIIIEHIHPLNYDYLISVIKDEEGVSSLTIE